MPIVGVVADANVLLSAITGRAALRVFTEHDLAVHVAQFDVDEVLEYLPAMAARYGLDPVSLELLWALLPKRVHPFEVYRSHFAWAVRALARRLRLPLWSNDRDLQGLSIPCHTTARLLAMLAHQRESE